MAVYTDVAADELAEFLRHYDIGELLSYKGIAEGVENSNFLLHTTAGYFILTLYEKRVAKSELPFFLGLMTHLASRGIICPQPLKNRSGEALSELAGRPAVIINFLEGIWPRKPNAAHCAAVGQALAKMHLAGRDFPMTRPNALSVSGWRPLFEQAAPRADERAARLARFSPRRARLPRRQRLAEAFAAGRDPCRPVSGQRVLSRRAGVRPDRLHLRLQRHAGLRCRDLPQRLVLRERLFVQRHQGARAFSAPMAASAN